MNVSVREVQSVIGTERERETDRQTNRETERQRDRDRQRQRETDRQIEKETERDGKREREREIRNEFKKIISLTDKERKITFHFQISVIRKWIRIADNAPFV